MDDLIIWLVNLLPAKWHISGPVLIGASLFVGRAIHALRNGGGLKGVISSIWYGTNTPKSPEPTQETKP